MTPNELELSPSTAKVSSTGVIIFLISEFFLFGSLFFVYYYLRVVSGIWPPADVQLSMFRPVLNTVLLLTSSVTMAAGLRSWRKNDIRSMIKFLGITIGLGIAFLGITVWEWTSETFQPWSHAYGSIFFTLTGFHAMHVLGGVLLMLALVTRANHGGITPASRSVELGSWYWHYVDAVWILVFTSIFIVR